MPLLIVPPTINKYYAMDLAPGRSLVEYLVRQGQQVFVISWRNPDARHADWGLDTYVQAILDALDAVERITGDRPDRAGRRLLRRHPRQHRGRLPGRDRPAGPAGRVQPAGDGARQRARPARVGALVDRAARRRRRRPMSRRTRLPRRPGAGRGVRLAAPGRPDLELLGQQLPARQEAAGVRHPVLERRHHPDDRRPARRLRRPGDGQPARPTPERSPCSACRSTCPRSTSTPTSSPASPTTSPRGRTATAARSCSAATTRFVLSTSGHIAALVNPPGNPKASYQVNKDNPADPARLAAERRDASRAAGGPTSPAWLGERCGADTAGTRAARRRRPAAARRRARHLRLRQLKEQRHVREHRPLAGHRLLPHRRPAHRRGAATTGGAPATSSTTRCCRSSTTTGSAPSSPGR